MFFQLSELEFSILDGLADGTQQLTILVREMRRHTPAWDPAVVMSAFTRLAEHRLIRYTPLPGASAPQEISVDALQAHLAHFPVKQKQPYWVELTDEGQNAWESWKRVT